MKIARVSVIVALGVIGLVLVGDQLTKRNLRQVDFGPLADLFKAGLGQVVGTPILSEQHTNETGQLLPPHDEDLASEIVGKVEVEYGESVSLPGYAGKTLPDADAPVYIFGWDGSGAIRAMLEKLEQDMCENTANSNQQRIIEKRREDIYKLVTTLPPLAKTKTDKNGRFRFRNLRAGEKYLVIVPQDIYEVGIIFLYEIVGPLKDGENRIRLVDKIG